MGCDEAKFNLYVQGDAAGIFQHAGTLSFGAFFNLEDPSSNSKKRKLGARHVDGLRKRAGKLVIKEYSTNDTCRRSDF